MGFRTGAYAMVWSVEPKSDTWTKARISISRKVKNSDEYEQDFSGFVDFSGTASAKKAAALKPETRIKLGDVDVTNKYDSKNGVTYTNYKIWSFEPVGSAAPANDVTEPQPAVDSGEVDDARLPF